MTLRTPQAIFRYPAVLCGSDTMPPQVLRAVNPASHPFLAEANEKNVSQRDQQEELRVALVDGQKLYDLSIEIPSREQKRRISISPDLPGRTFA